MVDTMPGWICLRPRKSLKWSHRRLYYQNTGKSSHQAVPSACMAPGTLCLTRISCPYRCRSRIHTSYALIITGQIPGEKVYSENHWLFCLCNPAALPVQPRFGIIFKYIFVLSLRAIFEQSLPFFRVTLHIIRVLKTLITLVVI